MFEIRIQFRHLFRHFNYDAKATLSVYHRHKSALTVGANHGVRLPVTHLLSKLNVNGPIAQGASVHLTPFSLKARLALSLFILAAIVFPQRAALSVVRINMLVKRFITSWQFACNLIRAQVQLNQVAGLLRHPGWHGRSIPALLRTLSQEHAGLIWPVAFKATIARKLPTDGRFVSIKQLGDVSLIVSCFHKCVGQISFNLAEMFVVHGQIRLAGQEALNAKHSEPPSLQLINVALRA
jgi:hypothetical protein